MDWQAVRLSVVLAASTTVVLVVIGLPIAYWLAYTRWRWKFLVEAVVALPLVLPPTVLGFYVLVALGPRSPIGRWYEALTGGTLPFSFQGLLVASVLYSLPFAVQPFASALASVDRRLLEASWCLGVSRAGTFFRVAAPLALPGIVAGMVLTFAHTLGEFGVVLMVGGNLAGRTRTVSIAIYDSVQALDYSAASETSLFLLAVSFAVLAVTYGLQRKAWGSLADAMVIEVEKAYPGGLSIEFALELPVDRGSVTVLFGPSGAGKTTILRCLAGLERPDRGVIRFGGETWFDSARGIDLPPQQRRAGLLFQDYALFPHLTVAANIAYGLGHLADAERRQRLDETLARLRLEPLLDRRPAQLSGGEKQRVALGRALAPKPRVLLLDEPLSALDAPTRQTLRSELRRLLAGLAQPTLVVTHDRIEALALGDRMAVISEGRLRQVGPIEDIFSHPADFEVARAVGVETVRNARVVDRHGEGLATIEVDGVRLTAMDPGGGEDAVFACIRAEEVLLERGPVGQVSARNRLQGTVSSVTPEGPLVRVVLDCGFPLAAVVTRQACRDLDIKEGERLTAFVKSPSVHLIPRGGSSGTLRAS